MPSALLLSAGAFLFLLAKERMTTYAIAVNRHYKGKAPSPAPKGFWATYNRAFVNECLTMEQFISEIRQGHGYTTHHHKNREAGAFIQAQHLALDFDTGDERSSLSALSQHAFIASYAAFAYTTPSHTDLKPRARVVFLLDRPITNATEYTELAHALVEVIPYADQTCKDCCRIFYGSEGCDYVMLQNTFAVDEAIQSVVNPHRERKEAELQKQEELRQAKVAKYGNVAASDKAKIRYAQNALDSEYKVVSGTIPNFRHKAILDGAIKLGGLLKADWMPTGGISESQIVASLLAAARRNGEIDKYGELNVSKTIRDGLAYAEARKEPVWKRDEQGEAVPVEDELEGLAIAEGVMTITTRITVPTVSLRWQQAARLYREQVSQ